LRNNAKRLLKFINLINDLRFAKNDNIFCVTYIMPGTSSLWRPKMTDQNWLTKKFEESRSHLESVAYRLLGSRGEADDAVQEAWLRVTRADTASIENFGGWLTTIVSRICLDMLRSRKVRQVESMEQHESGSFKAPEEEILLADAMGPALLVVLETLTPPERVAFVLHDLFDLAFEDIAAILGRSDVATRQLASRARNKVRGVKENSKKDGQEIVAAFLAASREGNFENLLKLLDPNIVLRADKTAIQVSAANKDKGAPQFESEMRSGQTIANLFKGRAVGAQLAFLNGMAGATWIACGKPRVVFAFTFENGKITEIGVIMNPDDLNEIEIKLANEGVSS
jgi:RNA polymerase sigma factor (sigma-70 family)